MTPKIRNALFFIFLNICCVHSQTRDSIPPGKYMIDSLEWEKLCKPEYILEYYNVDAKLKMSSYQLLNDWNAVFKKPDNFKQTGFLTIRFIINCHLELCCFNTYEMDEKYQPIKFDDNVKAQLIAFIKTIKGWKSSEYKGKQINYRYYLNFTIQNGEFKRVSP